MRTCILAISLIALMAVRTSGQQQTVGIFLNTSQSWNGYTLMSPLFDTTVYLLDNCGRVVHRWVTPYGPGLSAFLLPDGSLLRPINSPNPAFGNSGGGGVEKRDWNNNVTWTYWFTDSMKHQHHDICPMPNGNVLLLAYEFISPTQAAAAGRKVASSVWPELIVEVQPTGAFGGNVVWEWHSWDHAIQQYDSTKPNYGVVADHPELFHLNYPASGGNGNNPADWLHANGIDYNAELDQIIMSARAHSEFYIIDHSTSTAQAASHSGGRYGKGGDILYRWGNPAAYNRDSTARTLYFQHHAQWIKNGLPGAGHILVFNNGTNRPGGNSSSVDELIPPTDSAGFYTQPGTAPYGPSAAVWSYKATPPGSFYSPFIGGCHRLANGNTFVCDGVSGRLVEVDSTGNKVWQYINAAQNGKILSQGDTPTTNFVFRAYRYHESYAAFKGKTLVPQGYVEQNPGTYTCTIFPDTVWMGTNPVTGLKQVQVYPNPCVDKLTLDLAGDEPVQVNVTNVFGELVYSRNFAGNLSDQVDVRAWKNGLYFMEVYTEGSGERKVFKLMKR